MYNKSLSETGFSLIQLLVSIVIIAILMVIIFPIFSKVNKRILDAKCVANMRQIGLGFQQYITENNGYFFSKHPDQLNVFPAYIGINTVNNPWPYTKSPSVLTCPAVLNLPEVKSAKGAKDGATMISANYYLINQFAYAWEASTQDYTGVKNPHWPMRVSDIAAPAKMFIYTEGAGRTNGVLNDNAASYLSAGSPPYMIFPHQNRQNFLFLDGHVEPLTLDQIPYNQVMPGDPDSKKQFWGYLN